MSPLAILTRGWISPSTEKALTIITIGWLSVSSVQPSPTPNYQPQTQTEIEEGGSGAAERIRAMRRRDDDEIYNILKMWTQCQG